MLWSSGFGDRVVSEQPHKGQGSLHFYGSLLLVEGCRLSYRKLWMNPSQLMKPLPNEQPSAAVS